MPMGRGSLWVPSLRGVPTERVGGCRVGGDGSGDRRAAQCHPVSPPAPPRSYPDEEGPKHWPPSRYEHVMKLRQAALESARAMWADYLLVRGSRHPGEGGTGHSTPGWGGGNGTRPRGSGGFGG